MKPTRVPLALATFLWLALCALDVAAAPASPASSGGAPSQEIEQLIDAQKFESAAQRAAALR